MFIITNKGVFETETFINQIEIRKRLQEKARELNENEWFDNFEERQKIDNMLRAGSIAD
jgi:hypothetical protein